MGENPTVHLARIELHGVSTFPSSFKLQGHQQPIWGLSHMKALGLFERGSQLPPRAFSSADSISTISVRRLHLSCCQFHSGYWAPALNVILFINIFLKVSDYNWTLWDSIQGQAKLVLSLFYAPLTALILYVYQYHPMKMTFLGSVVHNDSCYELDSLLLPLILLSRNCHIIF